MIDVHNIQVGDRGRIAGFAENSISYRQKLLAMGLTPGTEFEIIRIAPLGDPIEIRIRDADLSLHRDEFTGLLIETDTEEKDPPEVSTRVKAYTVAIIGNPNCGKSTLFNGLTGAHQHVGNWAGVTVEKKVGLFRHFGTPVRVVDLPGIYSIDTRAESGSPDEKIARDYVLSRQADLIVNIVDTSHLEHNLYLTVELLELELPVVVVLNIMKDWADSGFTINVSGLRRRLHSPVVSLVAVHGGAVESLKSEIVGLLRNSLRSTSPVRYSGPVDAAVRRLSRLVEKQFPGRLPDKRWLAIQLLENDDFALGLANSELKKEASLARQKIRLETGEDADILIAGRRYEFIHRLVKETFKSASPLRSGFSDAADRIILNRILGIPIFFAVMYLMFTFTIKLGRAFKPLFNDLAQAVFVDGAGYLLGMLGSPRWLISLLAEGLGNGIREVWAFIPILGFLYLFISILEESGYMARATFVMDRFMQCLGLPGKSFVPMILGFGCNVPAMMATRTLERERDRFLSILLNPFMTCGARMAVFTIFAAAFFPDRGEIVVFTLYLIGVFFAVLTALIMKNTLLKEERSLLIMEIPSYRRPTLKNIWINTWMRVQVFVFRVGKIIVSMVLVLHILSAWHTDGSFGESDLEQSVLAAAGRAVTPALAPMGIRESNWPATVAVFTGVLHKVVVVSTLKTLYTGSGQTASTSRDEGFDFSGSVRRSFLTVPVQFKAIFGLGSAHDHLGDRFALDSALQDHFDGQIGAFAYLLFVLLYFPCIATTATAYRESSLGWSVFMVVWSTGLAYLTASLFYQMANFSAHPLTAIAWLIVSILAVISAWLVFRFLGGRQNPA